MLFQLKMVSTTTVYLDRKRLIASEVRRKCFKLMPSGFYKSYKSMVFRSGYVFDRFFKACRCISSEFIQGKFPCLT